MKTHVRPVVAGLLVGLLLVSVHAAQAQYAQAQPPKKEKFDASGTVQGVSGLVIQMTIGEDAWLVGLTPPKRKYDKEKRQYVSEGGTELKIEGTATLDFLKRGMFVRYTANFNRKGKTDDKVNSLTIFTPNDSQRVGIFPENPAIALDPNDAAATAPYLVAGTLVSAKNGKLSVRVAGRTISAELAEEPVVNLSVSDLRYLAKGAKIDVKGHYFVKGKAIGETVEVQLVEPLTGTAKKPPAKTPPAKKPAAEPVKEPPAKKPAKK